METSSVAPDNSRVLTVKLGRETSLIPYSTDKRSTLAQVALMLTTISPGFLACWTMLEHATCYFRFRFCSIESGLKIESHAKIMVQNCRGTQQKC